MTPISRTTARAAARRLWSFVLRARVVIGRHSLGIAVSVGARRQSLVPARARP